MWTTVYARQKRWWYSYIPKQLRAKGEAASEEEEGDAVKEFSYASFHSRRFPRLMLLNFSSFFIRSEK